MKQEVWTIYALWFDCFCPYVGITSGSLDDRVDGHYHRPTSYSMEQHMLAYGRPYARVICEAPSEAEARKLEIDLMNSPEYMPNLNINGRKHITPNPCGLPHQEGGRPVSDWFITEEVKKEIRRRWVTEYITAVELAEDYGISSTSVYRLLEGLESYRNRVKALKMFVRDAVIRKRWVTEWVTQAELAEDFSICTREVIHIVKGLKGYRQVWFETYIEENAPLWAERYTKGESLEDIECTARVSRHTVRDAIKQYVPIRKPTWDGVEEREGKVMAYYYDGMRNIDISKNVGITPAGVGQILKRCKQSSQSQKLLREREEQVMRYYSEGMKQKEIAKRVGMSKSGVAKIIGRYKKRSALIT